MMIILAIVSIHAEGVDSLSWSLRGVPFESVVSTDMLGQKKGAKAICILHIHIFAGFHGIYHLCKLQTKPKLAPNTLLSL